MKRLMPIIAILLISTGCSQADNAQPKNEQTQTEQAPPSANAANLEGDSAMLVQNEVEEAVLSAIANNDTQLLAITGRRIVLPGTDAAELETLKQQCGYKILPGYTDTIKSEADREKMKQLRQYAAQYNQLMLAHCQQK